MRNVQQRLINHLKINIMKIEKVLHSNVYSSHECCVIDYHPYTDTLAQINYVYQQSARRNKTPKTVGIWRVNQQINKITKNRIMKTALQQYIEDIKNGNCKGEEFYLQTEKQQITDLCTEAYEMGLGHKEYSSLETYASTFGTNKETLK